jgi:hypothetical protein
VGSLGGTIIVGSWRPFSVVGLVPGFATTQAALIRLGRGLAGIIHELERHRAILGGRVIDKVPSTSKFVGEVVAAGLGTAEIGDLRAPERGLRLADGLRSWLGIDLAAAFGDLAVEASV